MLSQQGFFYPQPGTRWWGHHPLAWAAGVPHPSADPAFDAESVLSEYLEASHKRTLVLSSEDFYGVADSAGAAPIRKLSEAFCQMDVVMYIRHPVDWVVSAFKWNVEKDPTLVRCGRAATTLCSSCRPSAAIAIFQLRRD